ncbi:MAG TPA: methyltransferase, partial [Gammaproteobacteria bacterium]|nr:methyltransferase [Gammaproteobacteria bacterium]
MTNILEQLAEHDIHPYGSDALLRFEKQMEKYFSREYERWRGNRELPEKYDISSFEGDIAKRDSHVESIEHYNKAFKIYQTFLDEEYMVYTMAHYGITESSLVIDETLTLAQAQKNKFDLIIERADIKNGQSILELGCGFGGFSRYLLERFPDIRITGINPSPVQTDHLKEILLNDDRFSLVQKYFDELTQEDLPDASFDRVLSIGVLEAVTNLDKLFQLISRVLKPGGKTFHHFIVSTDTIPQFLNAESTLMADYFPGGHIWPYEEPRRHNTHLQLV